MQFVDRIIFALSLQRIDEGDIDVPVFRPDQPPMVFTPDFDPVPERCRCISPALPTSPGDQGHYAATFIYVPPWTGKSDQENDKEECRRICWAALTLMSNYTATCAVFHQEPVTLQLTDPCNVSWCTHTPPGSFLTLGSQFALLFPGEDYERVQGVQGRSPKQSVWALYCRSMLLWNSVSQRRQQTWSTELRGRFAVDAFNEARIIQEAIDMHQCNLDTSLIYLTREFIYK